MCYSNPNQILVFHPLNDASNTNRVKQTLESNRKKGREKIKNERRRLLNAFMRVTKTKMITLSNSIQY